MTWKRMLNVFERRAFVCRNNDTLINNQCTLNVRPMGALLLENLRHELINDVIIKGGRLLSTSIFLQSHCDNKSFDCVTEMVGGTSGAFGLAHFHDTSQLSTICDTNGIHFRQCFDTLTIFKCEIYVAAPDAQQFFYKWQRHRKIWWRKFSSAPGRYILTDIKANNDTQTVEIQAEYKWGTQHIESIKLINNPSMIEDGTNRAVEPNIIVTEVPLQTMLLNYLCDSYTETNEFQFHHKVAPYKISFVIAPDLEPIIRGELKDLAQYICQQLRSSYVSVLLWSANFLKSIDDQCREYDEIGVPYNIVLDEETLKSGVLLVRNRYTTLKEEVHVGDIVTHVKRLLQNCSFDISLK